MHNRITRDMRVCMALLLRKDYSHSSIASELGCHRTTISREIRRNGDNNHYPVVKAHKRVKVRRKQAKKDWSPEQIDCALKTASLMTIYRYIDRYPHLKRYSRRK